MKAESNKKPAATADALFKDFTNSDPWRIFRIMAEFVDSFETMSQFDHVITVFGSARTAPEEPDYQEAEKLGRMLAEAGHPVLTGGGPGIMEAANKGAKEAGGISIGLNIKLPMEQSSNSYLTDEVDFHYFFIRKVNFLKYTEGVAVFPGGFGTMDEFFEVVTLIQTNKMPAVPICLVCSDFWQPVIDWFTNCFIPKGKISPEDMNLFHVVDSAEEAMNIFKKNK
jgi:uncharacterized protein (TIGR00730 family)